MGLMQGMNDDRISSAINTYLSHIQIHNKHFLEDPVLENHIHDLDGLVKRIKEEKEIKAYSTRILVDAMVSTSKGSYGARLVGVIPEKEKEVSSIPTKLAEGTYLNKYKKPSIVIGKKLADKLGVKLKSKVKFSFQNEQGDILAYSFRVEGIYKISNTMLEKVDVFIKQKDLQKILGSHNMIHEIGILLNDLPNLNEAKAKFQQWDLQNEVQTWDEVSPELGYAQEMMATFSYVFMAIILIALAFAIVNTMLMAVLERQRELGIMMAVGFNKTKLFLMIVFETIFLAAIATPAGMLISYQSIEYFGKYGMHFLSVSEGLEYFGMESRIYTHLDFEYYIVISLMTLTTAFIAALLPAKRALNTKPIKAIRDV
jgi:ABC-type lipoprotein release transport system permease subunit